MQVDGLACDGADRLAGEPAGDAKLVEIDGELLRPGEHDHGRGADHDGDRHRLFSLAVFEPVQEAAGAGRLARHHAHDQPVGGFERRAVSAHVLHAALGIAGDAQSRRQIRRRVEAGRRDRHRQGGEAAGRSCRSFASDHDLLARRGADDDRRDRMRDRLHPGCADLLDLAAHADGVNLRRSRERADHNRNVVLAALGIDDVGEDERAALFLRLRRRRTASAPAGAARCPC